MNGLVLLLLFLFGGKALKSLASPLGLLLLFWLLRCRR